MNPNMNNKTENGAIYTPNPYTTQNPYMQNSASPNPYAFYQPKPKVPFNNTAIDGFFAFLIFAIGFFYMEFVFTSLNALGAGVSVFTVILFVFSFAYIKQSNLKMQNSWIIYVCIFLSAMVFLLYSNNLLAILNLIFLSVCFVYWVGTALGTRIQDKLGSFAVADLIKHIFVIPFANFGASLKSMQGLTSKSGKAKSVLLLVGGILIAFPLTLIIVLLLSNADQAFSGLVNTIISSFWGSVPRYIADLLLGIPVSLYLFGLLYGCVKKRKTDTFTKENIRETYLKLRFVPGIMACGALISFLMVYTLFYMAQFQYLFSAFNSVLPSGFSYAEYARRGFFELCTVACINLLIIISAKFFVKFKGESNKTPKPLKAFNICLSVYTLGFISIALSKMFMYISAYGLTRLRVYTSWFMVFLFIVFAVIILRQLFRKINTIRIITCTGAAMFLILCFANTDSLIAKYNVEAYLDGKLQIQISDLAELSDSAAPYLEQVYLRSDDQSVKKEAKLALQEMKNKANRCRNSWKTFNLSTYKAMEIYQRF